MLNLAQGKVKQKIGGHAKISVAFTIVKGGDGRVEPALFILSTEGKGMGSGRHNIIRADICQAF